MHDSLKKGVLSLLISAIALAEKEAGKTLEKEEELAYVQRELKQTRETLAETPASRQDLIDETNQKIALLESYLPRQLSDEEITAAIEGILKEKGLEPVKRSQGIVMVDQILKGTSVSDIPVKVFDSDLYIYVNKATADALGITLPDSITSNAKYVEIGD